jgi:hypothetical protein
MGTESMGRIIDPHRELMKQVDDYLKLKEWKKSHPRGLTKFLKKSKTVNCSQCKRKMSESFAKLQIENKRENAPICIPCCCGYKRRPLSEVENFTKHFSKTTKKKFNLR